MSKAAREELKYSDYYWRMTYAQFTHFVETGEDIDAIR
jgi:hypothetical protein